MRSLSLFSSFLVCSQFREIMGVGLLEVNLNNLVSNIIGEHNYSHCRLCLKQIQDRYIQFSDCVTLDTENASYSQPISELLATVLGLHTEISEEIPGINAICTDCVDRALESVRFVKGCREATELLSNVFERLTNTLDIEIKYSNENQKLYITVDEFESKVVLVEDSYKNKRSMYVTKNKQLNCPECNKQFKAITELKSHNITQHARLTCDQCLDIFQYEEDLDFHVSQKHKYTCSDCSQGRSTEASLKDHYNKAHGTYVCKDCGKTFKGLEKLTTHEQTHKKNIHGCPKCGKKYLTRDFFLKHVHLCMNGLLDPHPIRSDLQQSYSCEMCRKCYSTSGGLRVHMRFEHGGAKYHVCELCNKKFTAPSYLKIHMVKHTGEKNFPCDICNNKFVSKEALLYHTRRHTGEKPYQCKFCEETFVNASARAEHIKFKHVVPSHKCHLCPRKFVTSFFLKKHLERHHDPRSKLYHMRFSVPVSTGKRIKEENSSNSDELGHTNVGSNANTVIILS